MHDLFFVFTSYFRLCYGVMFPQCYNCKCPRVSVRLGDWAAVSGWSLLQWSPQSRLLPLRHSRPHSQKPLVLRDAVGGTITLEITEDNVWDYTSARYHFITDKLNVLHTKMLTLASNMCRDVNKIPQCSCSHPLEATAQQKHKVAL